MNISATSGPITTKFYLKHHWVEGKAALGFGPDRIRTLVSMATESSHSYNGENGVSIFSRLFFIRSFSYLQVLNDDMHESSDEFEFQPARTTDCGVSCP